MSSAGPIHSAASITPRCADGTISPPGSATPATPISLKISPVIPGGARYFIFLKSATLAIGVLNQPSGSGPIGCTNSGSTFTLSTSLYSLRYRS
jgi:hypothetical protein